MVKFDMLTEAWQWLCGYGCWGYCCPTEAAAWAELDAHKCRKDS